jgi:dienelactone hydrolase
MKNVTILTIFLISFALVAMTSGCEAPNAPDNGGGDAADTCKVEPVVWEKAKGAPPTGPYEVSIELHAGLEDHTVYRPEGVEGKMPIVAWANGGCLKTPLFFAEFLVEIASHGFLVIADGLPGRPIIGKETIINPTGETQMSAVDWAIEQNEVSCSPLFGKVETTKIAVMGQSCGGLMTYQAATDPRVTTFIIWNSGLFKRDQELYDALHTPMAIFNGGEQMDVAYPQGEADFEAINHIPIFYGNLEWLDRESLGHGGTYWSDNGGEFARVGVAWLKYQLMGEKGPEGAQMFEGEDCGLCNTEWIVKKKNMK